MNQIDKNTDEWRHLFMMKSKQIDTLKRYKFLVAAVLENAKDYLRKDLKEFRFAHDENERNMREIFGNRMSFDLNEYLTTVFSPQNRFVVEEK